MVDTTKYQRPAAGTGPGYHQDRPRLGGRNHRHNATEPRMEARGDCESNPVDSPTARHQRTHPLEHAGAHAKQRSRGCARSRGVSAAGTDARFAVAGPFATRQAKANRPQERSRSSTTNQLDAQWLGNRLALAGANPPGRSLDDQDSAGRKHIADLGQLRARCGRRLSRGPHRQRQQPRRRRHQAPGQIVAG